MSVQSNLDRFQSKKWGIFHHFLGGNNAYEWNCIVNRVNVNRWAEQLAELGCGFMGITLMQLRHTMLAPNATYDRITGYKPGEACAQRDFVMDLSDALRKYDIDLMLYFTGDGPSHDVSRRACDAFGFSSQKWVEETKKWEYDHDLGFYTEEYVDKWVSVMEEYALRYGDRVFAWWLDGCYEHLYETPEIRDKYLAKFKAAARAGNPDALITFNAGYSFSWQKRGKPFSSTSVEDFTPGEEDSMFELPESRYVDGKQWFAFYCNGFWVDREKMKKGDHMDLVPTAKYTPDEIYDHVKKVNEKGGIVMFDTTFFDYEVIDPRQFHAMSKLKNL